MQSASLRAAPGAAWERTRQAVPAATLWSALVILFLIVTIAESTVSAAWVPGLEIAPLVAVAGGRLVVVLVVIPLPRLWRVLGSFALGTVSAVFSAAVPSRAIH